MQQRILTLVIILLLSINNIYADISPTKYSYLDWFNTDNTTACSGAYFEPVRDGINDTKPLGEAITNIYATEFNYDLTQNKLEFKNSIKAQIGSLQIEAQSGSIDRKQNMAHFQDSIRLRDKGTLLIGENLSLDLNQEQAKLDSAEYVLHDGQVHGNAKFLERSSDKTITLKSATYSRCRPGSNAWYLKSNLIKLDPTSGFGSATNVVLRVKDVPVLYFPYISFPIDSRRSSGFLSPSLSSSDDYGLSIGAPYYLNLAPNYDATIYPTYMEKSGLLIENELRFLSPNATGQIWLGAIDDQKPTRANQSLYQTNRWAYQLKYDFSKHHISTGLSLTKLGDPYYLHDLPSKLGASDTNFIENRFYVTHSGTKLVTSLNVVDYEAATISKITPYNQLPHINFNAFNSLLILDVVNFQRDLKSGFFVDQNNNTSLWLDERIKGLARAEGYRSHVELNLSHAFNFSSAYIKPQINLLQTNYSLSLDNKGVSYLTTNGQKFKPNVERSLAVAQLDTGINFKIDEHKTLTPRVMAIYIPYKDQTDIPVFDSNLKKVTYASLWQFNRFRGLDRIGDTEQISYGLSFNSLADDGRKIQTINVGRLRHFNEQKVQLPGLDYKTLPSAKWHNSPYVAEYWRKINSDWALLGQLNWQQEDSTTKLAQIGFNYQDQRRKILNVNYSYQNDNVTKHNSNGLWQPRKDYVDPVTGEIIANYYKTNALNISGSFPITYNLDFLMHLNYDYNRRRTEEYFAGIGYQSCCWNLKLINRYWLDDDDSTLSSELNRKSKSGIFLQISLTGLGNLAGGDVTNLLHNKIQGFKENE